MCGLFVFLTFWSFCLFGGLLYIHHLYIFTSSEGLSAHPSASVASHTSLQTPRRTVNFDGKRTIVASLRAHQDVLVPHL